MSVDVELTTPLSAPSITRAERDAVAEVLQSGWITQGTRVQEFEQNFARYIGCDYGVACSSGTAALHLALRALDIGHWDEVLIPDISFIATANAVHYCGAKPILCDVDKDTWGISAEDAKQKKTIRTRAIIAVHLYGKRCDLDGLHSLGVPIIEDAAQAIGLSGLGRMTAAATFSFYGNKVITTGEGGMVVTFDKHLAARCRLLRGHAMHPVRKYYHTEVGFNYRMTDMQAALGIAQLQRVEELLYKRWLVMRRYESCLPNFQCTRLLDAPWLFTFAHPRRDAIAKALKAEGVETRPCFEPFHRQPKFLSPSRLYPTSEYLAQHLLSLPTYPDLSLDDVESIAEVVCSH